MKIYEMAAVIDCGKYYEVEYITASHSKDLETNKKFLGLSNYTAIEIKKEMDNGNIVRIITDYQNIDVQPHDLIIVKNTDNDIELNRQIYLKKVRQMVTHQQANVSGLMMYQYININNILCDKGFFIHDDNKEEIYLKILETGDEQLIDKLEEYLNARDVISRSSYLEHKYFDYYKNITNAQTLDDILELFNQFTSTLNIAAK